MKPRLPSATRILGIDPGTLRLGFGILDAEGSAIVHVESGVITMPAGWKAERRLGELSKRLEAVIASAQPEAIAMEASFFGKNPHSLIRMGEARGMVLSLAGRAGLAVHDYPPATVKLAVTGKGSASKEQVERVLAALLPGLPRSARAVDGRAPTKAPESGEGLVSLDRTDALAVAWCHLQHRRKAALVDRLAQAARRS